MKLEKLQDNWDTFGRENPMWAVLTSTAEWEPEAFFSSGVQEVKRLLAEVEDLYPQLLYGRALDFGCGIGRLSQALAQRFARVDGVDIAASMVDGARKHNRAGDRCSFHLNARSDLALFTDETFDFIYTNIVLQHMEPGYARRYIAEFLRVLKPGGLLAFQLPSHMKPDGTVRGRIRQILPASLILRYRSTRDHIRRVPNAPRMEMYGIPREAVVHLLERGGAKVVRVSLDEQDTAHEQWVCYRYFAVKPR